METIAVVDFETTGLGPGASGRATEVAAVLVRGGVIVDAYSSLMNSGAWVPPMIEQLTGISNEMLAQAPDSARAIRELAEFTAGCPLVAHNAAFDQGFWRMEFERAELPADPAHEFVCTVLMSRRVWPEAGSHRLGALAQWHGLVSAGRAHRALADAQVTAQLLLKIRSELIERFAYDLGEAEVDHALLRRLQRTPKRYLRQGLKEHVHELLQSRSKEKNSVKSGPAAD